MHQPILWHEWGAEAFDTAQRENKPMLLDIGAVWCHWCHVMDRESYDDPETAAIVNQHFIAVKVDRDERPDIDSRYQAAVQAVSGQGGWPLTAFLTPDGKPFYGGTYFPPSDGYGRPSFRRVLLSIASAYAEKHGDVVEQAKMVESAIAQSESFAGRSGRVSESVIAAIQESAFKMFDPQHGGFGSAPKFPHPSALDLLIERFSRKVRIPTPSASSGQALAAKRAARMGHPRELDGSDDPLRNLILTTLEHMAKGGVYDQLAGGFHRYSVDERWVVPHFEKMCYDNSELLKNYVHAYQATGEEFFAELARDIIRWMDNHFDAWVNGAEDPISGQAEMLEEARMLGELHKEGWAPKRTIIYCAWDGEEPGLLGSVEWVETHLTDLQQHAVAYINSDSNERGHFEAGGTQDLQEVISGVTRDIQDPETHLSVFQRAHLVGISEAKDAEERAEARKRSDLEISALGDGSDYTAFQDFAGISTLDVGFGGEEDGDQYHSIYDDFYWYTHFVDTDFSYGRALAQTAGTTMMRLAGADLVPVDYAPQAEAIAKYETELEKLLKDKQEEITERNLELQEGVFTVAADPRKTFIPPPVEAVPPYMNFTPMKNSIETLKKSAERYSKALAAWKAAGSPALAPQSLETLNADLLRVSRLFLNEKGLPERPWFKNQIYAPGAYTGYGAKTVAAVREYMDEKKWKEAEAQIPQVAQVIDDVAGGIDKAAADFETALAQKR